MSPSSNKLQMKDEDGMGKAGKRQKMVENRSSERVPCEKVVCEKVYTMYLNQTTSVNSLEMMESKFCEQGTYGRAVGVSCEIQGHRHLTASQLTGW